MAGDTHTAAIFRWLTAVARDQAQSAAAFECAFAVSQRINRASKTAWPSREVVAGDMGLTGEDEAQMTPIDTKCAVSFAGHRCAQETLAEAPEPDARCRRPCRLAFLWALPVRGRLSRAIDGKIDASSLAAIR